TDVRGDAEGEQRPGGVLIEVGGDLGEGAQREQVGLVVAGAEQRVLFVQPVEDVHQQRVVGFGPGGGAVVGDHDAVRGVVVHVEVDQRHLGGAQVLAGEPQVVARDDVPGGALGEHGPVHA